MQRELSLAQISLAPISYVDFINAASRAGFRRVSLMVAPLMDVPASERRLSVCRMRDALQRANIRPLCASGLWVTPQTKRDLRGHFETAREIGVQFCMAMFDEPDAARQLDRYTELCIQAREFGLGLAVEFMAYSTVKSLFHAYELVSRSGQDNAGILLDTLHLIRSGGCARDIGRIDAARIMLAQLSDAPLFPPSGMGLREEALGRRRHPGTGELPLRAIVQALPSHIPLEGESPGADPAEYAPEQKAGAALCWLKKFCDE